jgi:N-acetylmuramate 1-kinase
MSLRDSQREAFFEAHGYAAARVEALPVDASFRRYFRLTGVGAPVLLMDAPPPEENVGPFVHVDEHLVSLGLSVPQIHAVDDVNGFVLLEDFGNSTYTRLLGDGENEAALYHLALDVLLHLHRHPDAASVDLPVYDEAVLLPEAALFTDWYVPAFGLGPCDVGSRQAWLDAWRCVFDALPSVSRTVVLRDFHVDNLMRLDGRKGVASCGLLDFQDALIGSGAYDLVSLLEDARRDVTPALYAELFDRYLAAFDDLDPETFRAWFAALGAQRHAKVAGIFVRLLERDGKDVYMQHVPRVMRLLRQALRHDALSPVRAWFEEFGQGIDMTGRLPG